MEDDYTGGDICIDGSTDCTGNDIVHGSRTDIHLKKKASPVGGAYCSHACACTYLSSFSSAGSASKSVMLFSTRMLYQEMSFLMSLS